MAVSLQRALNDAILYPLWLDHPDAPTPERPLIGPTEAGLVIVGAGFTGLWAAVQAKENQPDRDVVLVEANTVACGASGRPGGIVSTSVMHGLANAVRIFPGDLTELERLGHENMKQFSAALERHNIDAEVEWGGEMKVAVDERHLAHLDEEFDLHKKHGYDVVYLDRDAVRAEVDSPLFHGGVWSRSGSGIVHPAKLAWGLKATALRLGVRIYEHSPLIALRREGPTITVRTHDGHVRTPKVLLATNAFAAGDRRIKRRVAAIRDRIIATEPLTSEQLSRIGWANRQGLYDTRTQLNYIRLTKDNRIVFGGRVGYYYGNNTDPEADRDIKTYERLADAFFKTFPQLDDVRFSHAWGGPIALSTRMAVHFQTYHDGRVIWAGGYSGFGVSASRFGARVGLTLLDDPAAPERNLGLVKTMPNIIPPEPFRYIGAKITMKAIEDADERGCWRTVWVRLVHRMGFPL
jgi:glycine/D-amino acid oxidase-like deaminating enzyme